jgi:hypothetical protein
MSGKVDLEASVETPLGQDVDVLENEDATTTKPELENEDENTNDRDVNPDTEEENEVDTPEEAEATLDEKVK